MKKQGKQEKTFCRMLHKLIKGWYLYYDKCRRISKSHVYPMYIQIFILVKAAFFKEGIQAIQFNHKKTNKQTKTGILNNHE